MKHPFINEDFMLANKTAKELFYTYAANQPIIDYHCHLSPMMIAKDYKFSDAFELFLGGDHYKWRQMRSNGVPEEYITGDADPYEKFKKWAETLPLLIGNPLLHWNQLELKRFFDIDDVLCPETAEKIWSICNEKLAGDDFSAQSLITKSKVEVICTTDDPLDTLEHHAAIAKTPFGKRTKVLPTFRPDAAVEIGKDSFLSYIEKTGVKSYAELLAWLTARIAFFHENGCRLSDHGVSYVPYSVGDAAAIFDLRMNGKPLTTEQEDAYKTAVMQHCAREYARLGWTMQLHMGPMRNNNTAMFKKLGPDTGFDSINDAPIAERLSRFLDSLEVDDLLPKTILYNLNPKDNYVLGTMLGNFQKAPTPGKIQFGSGWWFCDQEDGMRTQMKVLANLGMLSRFVGMLTDSRSFVSYPRHEYFRRIMCSVIGEWVEAGKYPADPALLAPIVEGIAYKNAKNYFGF